MTEDFVRLNLDELDALKSALQLLSKKVSLSALYNKLQSCIEDIERVNSEPPLVPHKKVAQ